MWHVSGLVHIKKFDSSLSKNSNRFQTKTRGNDMA